MAEIGKVTPNQKCHRWSICVIYRPRCRGYRERHGDNPTLILYYSLHSAECQVMNMCHFVCRSLPGPGRASMENGVFRINDIENDREEIENSCLPEPCRLKCTSELSWVVPSSLSSSFSQHPLFKRLFFLPCSLLQLFHSGNDSLCFFNVCASTYIRKNVREVLMN